MTLTNVTVQFFFPTAGLTFINDYPSHGWGDLVADGTTMDSDGTTMDSDGTTLYGYTATYSDAGNFGAAGDAAKTPFTEQFAWFVPEGTDVGFSGGTPFVYKASLLANAVSHSATGGGTTVDSTAGSVASLEFQ